MKSAPKSPKNVGATSLKNDMPRMAKIDIVMTNKMHADSTGKIL
jgi:hypothetical protein